MLAQLISCPTCHTQIEWKQENIHRPFCSLRCKNIDLGAWANEDYVFITQDSSSSDHLQNSIY